MKYHVMAKPTWQGIFRRAGIEFAPKVPCQLERLDFLAVIDDIGKALVLVKFDEKGRPRPDWDRTQQLAAAVKRIKAVAAMLVREERGEYIGRNLGEFLSDFFPPLPIVEEPAGEGEPIPLEESAIPPKFHKALKAANLHDLDAIGVYLENHEDLTAIPNIGKHSSDEIVAWLERHLEPEQV